ncbi:MAG: hypothetical protein BGO25_05545 [Acidobacteriales bacterium 59-55]|nr:hypothetical protein [Terriglobales bacterium]OJV44546.1 MAG: hypothetical protein BGO25_05545 [Acidobacteriales bacterium 59-55]
MIDVVRDTEGLMLAFAEIFEQDFDRARISRTAESASETTRKRLLDSVAPLTLSPGYHDYAHHLIQLESEHEAGLALDVKSLTSFEAAGLVCLSRARLAFKAKHPPCSACGALQPTRFAPECDACGAKFQRRK